MTLPVYLIQYIFEFSNDLWIPSFEKNKWVNIINKRCPFIIKMDAHYGVRLFKSCYIFNEIDRSEEYYFTMNCVNEIYKYKYKYYSFVGITRYHDIYDSNNVETIYGEPKYFNEFKKCLISIPNNY